MRITKRSFGKIRGQEIQLYTITNAGGASVSVSDWGGILVSLCVPDKNGKLGDVLLGYDCAENYDPNPGYLGALIGRVGNRICHGRCTLNGQALQLATNSNGHHLHGGDEGFDRKLWAVEPKEGEGEASLALTYVSADGEENYPGELRVCVTYTFNDACELTIHYEAVSDKDTLCNLTNHAYFNLEGEGSGTILDHVLTLKASATTACDSELIPTGEIRPVDGTPFDMRAGKRLGDGIALAGQDEQITFGGGYDHNFVLDGEGMREVGMLKAPLSGRVMCLYTDMEAVQLYTGNMIDCVKPGKCGRLYEKHEALCLETQFHPDSINHPNFPDTVLRAFEKYDFTTRFAFSAE